MLLSKFKMLLGDIITLITYLLGPVGDRVKNHVRIQSFPVQQNAQQKALDGVLIGQCTMESTWRCSDWAMHNRRHVALRIALANC